MQVCVCVCFCVLVDEVVCAFLLDVVGVSEQPDDLVTGERQRHEHEQRLAGAKEAETEKHETQNFFF